MSAAVPVPDEAINAAIELLRAEGFRVDRPELGPWISPVDLWLEIGTIGYVGFVKRIHEFPGPCARRCGESGRLIELRASPELLAWLRRPAAPRRRARR